MKVDKTNIGRAIQFANSYGLDKESLQARIDWVEGEGTEYARRIVHEQYYPIEADKPAQTYVAAHEWLYPGMAGVDLVCHVDGTCNGLQHGAANTGDDSTAAATNCRVSSRHNKPEDIYQRVADTFLTDLKDSGNRGLYNTLKKRGRSLTKAAVMQTSYGASLETAYKSLGADASERVKASIDKDKDNVMEILKGALEEHAGAIIEMTRILKGALKGNFGAEITWKAHDGFPVFQSARSKVADEKEYLGAGEYSTRIDGATEYSQLRALGPNFVHTQDAAMLRETIRTCNFDMVIVHDSYGCRTEDWVQMYHKLRRAFVVIHQYDQGATMKVDKEARPVKFKKMGSYEALEVINAPYFFS